MNDDNERITVQDISASRLIAEISVLNDFSAILNEPRNTSFGGFVSVDDIYCSLSFMDDESGLRLNELCPTIQCEGEPEYYETNKPNAWRYMNVFHIGGGTVRIGIGFNDISGRIITNKGSIQFNPNKVRDCTELRMMFKKVSKYTKSVILKRYDVAADIPVSRDCCRMVRDKRGYEYTNHGRGITEYLGTRNKPGRVKLYDKTRELLYRQGVSLSEDITRLELTCDGDWTAEKALEMMPTVFAWDDSRYDEETRAWIKGYGMLAALAIKNGEQIDFALDILPKSSRKKVLEYLASPCVNLTIEDMEYARNVAYEWRGRIEKGQ